MDDIKLVKSSFTRCMGKDLIGRFYDIFLKSSPAIAPMFAKTDFSEQKKLLNHGIQLVIMYGEGDKFAEYGLGRIRDTHQKSKMDIPPNLYPFWKESFLQALAEADDEFEDSTREAWGRVLQKTLDFIIAGYEADVVATA